MSHVIMSNLRNDRLAMLILGVKGHYGNFYLSLVGEWMVGGGGGGRAITMICNAHPPLGPLLGGSTMSHVGFKKCICTKSLLLHVSMSIHKTPHGNRPLRTLNIWKEPLRDCGSDGKVTFTRPFLMLGRVNFDEQVNVLVSYCKGDVS